jgi:hypothetical protein
VTYAKIFAETGTVTGSFVAEGAPARTSGAPRRGRAV